MYHTSEHYRAIVDNGSVALAKSMDELIAETILALEHPKRRVGAMRKTLEQKAAYCDGTSAQRFVEALSNAIESRGQPVPVTERPEFPGARGNCVSPATKGGYALLGPRGAVTRDNNKLLRPIGRIGRRRCRDQAAGNEGNGA